ncbi:MAG: rod shape-determining protein MreC [Candidatus Marinimicrobia bacterium]|nr:rod shape-determining protein MreC [Candidatus Neomarinimicrobiota bacterium]MCD6101236.1 rod shape-determining protein MreC [Candidatus Neomarinimicrobiota bacterium]
MFVRILNFIYKNHEYFVFALLIILSIIILMTNDAAPIRKIQGKVADFFYFLHYPRLWINELSDIVEENRQLKRENLRLKLLNWEMLEAYEENKRLRKLLGFMKNTTYDIVSAKVLNRGVTPVLSSILINVGEKQGIRANMAVISVSGVVGKVVSSGENTSIVQVLDDVNFRLSVRFQTSRVLGIMKWRSGEFAEVRNIPSSLNIYPGEKVVTSGFSDIFPKGLLVGEVVEVIPSEDKISQVAIIRPFANLKKIEEVFVIRKF